MHSFYAGMGGFVFDMDSPDMKDGPSFMPKLGRLHVTPRGIQLLANCGLLPQISKKAIADKNKTDGAGKLLMMMMIVFTSGGVSTEYRPDRACHPHFSYGAAYEGF